MNVTRSYVPILKPWKVPVEAAAKAINESSSLIVCQYDFGEAEMN
jgi:hypothetical protein